MKIKANFITGCIAMLCMMVSSCNKIDELLTFYIYDEVTFAVERTSPLGLPLEIATPEVMTNSNQQFENNNTRASLVKDIKLDEMRLTITNPSGKTFSFLKSIALYISTDESNEVSLAHIDNIPEDVSTLTLITTDKKLDEYVKASSYTLRTRIVTRETLTQNVDITANLKFKVTASRSTGG